MAKHGADQISPVSRMAKRHESSEESLLKELTELIGGVREDLLKGQALTVASLQEEIQALRTDLSGEVKSLSEGLSKVVESADRNSTRIDELAERVHYLEEENKMLKMKQTDSENRDKRSNIVMQGISEEIQDKELEAEFQRIYVQHLKIDKGVTVERIHRIGLKPKGGRPRAVVVKLLCFKDRELIWENRCNLKGSSLFLEEHFAVDI